MSNSVDIEEKIEGKKQEYMAAIKRFLANKEDKSLFIDCLIKGTAYFNAGEKFVSQSSRLGLHNNGHTLTDLAESCAEMLKSYVNHINFIGSYPELLDHQYEKPETFACSDMQRMVKKYLPKEKSNAIKDLFVKNNLPIEGFEIPAMKNKIQITPISIIGLVLMLVAVAISAWEQNPSPTLFFMVRGLFSLSGAAFASQVPGMLNVNLKGYVTASGAIAIFVILWMMNPPALF